MGLGHRFWSRGHHGPTLPKALHDLRVGDTQPPSERAGSSGQRAWLLWRGQWAAGSLQQGFASSLLLVAGNRPRSPGVGASTSPTSPYPRHQFPPAKRFASEQGRPEWEGRGVSRSCAGWEQLSASGREPLLHFLWMSPLMGSRGWCLPGTLGMLTRHPCSEHPRSTCLLSPK